MNRNRAINVSLTALGLVLLLVPAAHAQGGGGGQRGGRGGVSLATMPVSAIDSVVTLTADEKSKIETIQATYKTDIAAASGDQQKSREVRTKATDDIKAALTTDQSAKLTETLPALSLLSQSKAVPLNVLAAVKLTAEQWTKIKTATTDTNGKIQALAREDRQTQRPVLLAEFKTTVTALLTTEQKDIITKASAPADAAAPGTKVL